MTANLNIKIQIDRTEPADIERDLKEAIRQAASAIKSVTGKEPSVTVDPFVARIPGPNGNDRQVNVCQCKCGRILFTYPKQAKDQWRGGTLYRYAICPDCERETLIERW